ncbi:MAG: FAD-dependent oxidoreductase, partial [Pseudomonadota bacterium]
HAAVVAADIRADLPVLYDNGIYVIARGDGTAAIGSTTEFDWQTATPEPSNATDRMIARACELCPELAGAEVIQLWAGVRPRAIGRDPLIGCLDAERKIWVATGGYKISLGIAHRMAAALVDRLTDAPTPIALPETFTPAHHIAKAREAQARAADQTR